MPVILHDSASADNTFLDLDTLEVVQGVSLAPTVTAEDRTARGIELFRSGAVRRLSGRRFSVRGHGGVEYFLRPTPFGDRERLACSCPDYRSRRSAERATCCHISAVSAYFAARWSGSGPDSDPEPPSSAAPLPFRPEPGLECVARLRGEDVPVRLGQHNPGTRGGRGFWATRLEDGRTITIPSPGNLRPAPSPANAAPVQHATEPGDALARYALALIDSLALAGLVIVEECECGVELLANGFREHEIFEPVTCSSAPETRAALERIAARVLSPQRSAVPADSRLCPEITWHRLGGR